MNEKTIIPDTDYYIRRSKSETARKLDRLALSCILLTVITIIADIVLFLIILNHKGDCHNWMTFTAYSLIAMGFLLIIFTKIIKNAANAIHAKYRYSKSDNGANIFEPPIIH